MDAARSRDRRAARGEPALVLPQQRRSLALGAFPHALRRKPPLPNAPGTHAVIPLDRGEGRRGPAVTAQGPDGASPSGDAWGRIRAIHR